MIKVQHLLAFSLSAIFAAQVNAETAGVITITGSITAPTCEVKAQAVELDSVPANSFKGKDTVAGEKSFTLSLVETGSEAPCPAVSYVANAITGESTPSINLSTTNATDDGYLRNSNYKEGERESLAVQIVNGTTVLDFKNNNTVVIKTEKDKPAVILAARYVALADVVDIQKVSASFNVDVDYK